MPVIKIYQYFEMVSNHLSGSDLGYCVQARNLSIQADNITQVPLNHCCFILSFCSMSHNP